MALLPALREGNTITLVRLLAAVLIALLLPLGMSVPSTMACSTQQCCGASCPSDASVNQVSCCQAPVAPERATSQALDVQHFGSMGTLTAAASIVLVSRNRKTAISDKYTPPDRLLSLALLCSRQI
jgi:hypothetical protein